MRKSLSDLYERYSLSKEIDYTHEVFGRQITVFDRHNIHYKPEFLGLDHRNEPIIRWEFKKDFDDEWSPLNNIKEEKKLNIYISQIAK